MEYIIYIYQYPDNFWDRVHCIAEIPMTHPPKNLPRFARLHGGDYAEVQLKHEVEENCFD